MLILFFKAAPESDSNKEPIADKMRRILESHVEDADTGEEREKAELDLAKFKDTSSKPQ
jgi:hypothetical protein